MDQLEPQPVQDRAWRNVLLLVLAVVAAVVAINVSGIRGSTARGGMSEVTAAIEAGDRQVKSLLAAKGHTARVLAIEATKEYQKALPWPAARRRIGLIYAVFLHRPGAECLLHLTSFPQFKSLPAATRSKLTVEEKMWKDVYDSDGVAKADVPRYVSLVRKLNLGPLKQVAVSQIYAEAGDVKGANAALARAKKGASRDVRALAVVGAVMVAAVLVGLPLGLSFLARDAETLQRAAPPRIDSSALFIAFTIYLVSHLLLALIAGIGAGLAGAGQVATLALEAVVTLAAFVLALAVAARLAATTRFELREVGLRLLAVPKAIKWGIGGYCAVLPFVAVAGIAGWVIFNGAPTPEHPITRDVAVGGMAAIIAGIIAVVIAPIVEETCFRGMLYTGLRGKMGVWPAAALSGLIFASLHPTLPLGLLPIWVLGIAFAIIRERTGSLIPSMICHALNNAIMLTIARLLY